jgi:hypothetical protein
MFIFNAYVYVLSELKGYSSSWMAEVCRWHRFIVDWLVSGTFLQGLQQQKLAIVIVLWQGVSRAVLACLQLQCCMVQ